MNNSIAVIMSLYKNDRSDFVKLAVESILHQTYSNFDFYKWEVIPNRVNDIYKNNKPLLVGYLSVIKKNIAQKCAYGQVNSRDEIKMS